jgi:type I restriction enzyme, R subunit
LTNVLEASLRRLNRISYRGKTLEFSPENIRKGVDAVINLAFESHQKTAQNAFDLLTLGTSLEQVIDGDQKSYSLRYVDWTNPANNVHYVTGLQIERVIEPRDRQPCSGQSKA